MAEKPNLAREVHAIIDELRAIGNALTNRSILAYDMGMDRHADELERLATRIHEAKENLGGALRRDIDHDIKAIQESQAKTLLAICNKAGV